MRLWSISLEYLDNKRIVALWREALLARAVLEGKTKGYKNHSQLLRFKSHNNPLSLINKYLSYVYDESLSRGFSFDKEKLSSFGNHKLPVSNRQLFYEFNHLNKKLDKPIVKRFFVPKNNPLFFVVDGDIESWERVKF